MRTNFEKDSIGDIIHLWYTYFDFDLYSRSLSKNSCWIGSDTFCMAGTITPKLRQSIDAAARIRVKAAFENIYNKENAINEIRTYD